MLESARFVWYNDLSLIHIYLTSEEEPPKPEDIIELSENCWEIQGGADLEDVDELVDANMPVDVYDLSLIHILNAYK